MFLVPLSINEGKRPDIGKRQRREIRNFYKASVSRCIMEQGTGNGKGQFEHAKEDGKDREGIDRVGRLVPTSGTLPPERRVGNGSGLCYLEDVPQEREIC